MPRGTFPAGEIAAGIVKGAIVIALLQTGDTVKGTSPWSSSGTLEWRTGHPGRAFRWESGRGEMNITNLS